MYFWKCLLKLHGINVCFKQKTLYATALNKKTT